MSPDPMSPVADAVVRNTAVTPHGPAEELFALDAVRSGSAGASGGMTLGPWLRDGAEEACAGSLAVLLDDVVGQAVLARMPADRWTVTTELSMVFPRALPTEGRVGSDAQVLHADPAGGVAQGRVVAEDGSLLATATVWALAAGGLPPTRQAATGGVERRRAGLAAALGAVEEADGVLAVAPSEWVRNAQGLVHGGVLGCLVEMGGRRGAAAGDARLGRPPAPWRTSSVHVTYLRPATAPLRVVPTTTHLGRSLARVHVGVVGESGKTAAEATVLLRRG